MSPGGGGADGVFVFFSFLFLSLFVLCSLVLLVLIGGVIVVSLFSVVKKMYICEM